MAEPFIDLDIPIGPVRFRINANYTLRGNIEQSDKKLIIDFPYNLELKDEIKSMDGARYMGYDDENPRKAWSVKDNERNRFQLQFLLGKNPYAIYDAPLINFTPRRKELYQHQVEIASHELTRHYCIIAGEPGVGKTLPTIELIEFINNQIGGGLDVWWCGPRSVLDAIRYEFIRWQVCDVCGKRPHEHRGSNHLFNDGKFVRVKYHTYEELKKIVENWPSGNRPPQFLVGDECQKVKTWTAQRSQAFSHLAASVRREWGKDGFVIEMSGTPAPKEPTDWWALTEHVCPGFLKEGNVEKSKRRLAKIEMYEGTGGGAFPKLITWWDNEKKCATCTKLEDDPNHDSINMIESWYHPFRPSVNEVDHLYKRMSGLVLVKTKEACLDLPEKIFKSIKIKPSPSVLRTASLIAKTAGSTIRAMTLCRELSDGFQYHEVPVGMWECDHCYGKKIVKMTVDADDPTNPLDDASLTRGHRVVWDENNVNIVEILERPLRTEIREISCPTCGGKGEVPHYERTATRVECPKDQEIINLLDQYEEQGRMVIWAGFTESIDRNVETCLKNNWPVIRLDGRHWWSNIVPSTGGVTMLQAFDDLEKYPRLAFVGQPGAGGMGINLTKSSVSVFYSNTFRYEDRAQAIDRIHRPGADHNRGCLIIDLVHLPEDQLVIDNLNKKRDLQSMSMGMWTEEVNRYHERFEREV